MAIEFRNSRIAIFNSQCQRNCSANSHIVISLTIVFLLFAIPLGYYGIDSLINPTSNSYSESIDFTSNEDVLRAIKFKSFDTDFGSVDTDDNWFVYSGRRRVGSIAVEEKSGNSAIIGIYLDAGVGTIVVRYKIYTDGTCTKLSER